MANPNDKNYSPRKAGLFIIVNTVVWGGLAALLGSTAEQPISSVYWAFFTALIIAALGTIFMVVVWFGSVKRYPKAHWRRVVIVLFELLGLVVCLFIGISVYASGSHDYTQEQVRIEQERVQQERNVQRNAISADGLYLAVNKVRAGYGAQALEANELLNKSAQMQCDDMSAGNYFANVSPTTGKNGYEYVKDAGTANYNYAMATTYAGIHYSADEVINAWAANEASKVVMIDAKYNQGGFAKCRVAQLGDQDVYVIHLLDKYVAPNVIYQQSAPVYTAPIYTPPSTYRCSEDYFGNGVTCRSSLY